MRRLAQLELPLLPASICPLTFCRRPLRRRRTVRRERRRRSRRRSCSSSGAAEAESSSLAAAPGMALARSRCSEEASAEQLLQLQLLWER
jgi:hypothetical protein